MFWRLIAVLPALFALLAARVLFAPYTQGWGCRPTFASVALVLVWLLPALGGLRGLFASKPDRNLVVASFTLALVALVFALEGQVAEDVSAQACR